MSLEIKANIARVQNLRASDEEFKSRFGGEAFNQKLKREGVYAFGFRDSQVLKKATSLLAAIAEEFYYGDKYLRDVYLREGRNSFDFRNWCSIIEDANEALVIRKPFPKVIYERRLGDFGIAYREIPVYRITDLTEDQIKGKSFGLWTRDDYLVDLAGSIKK